MIARIPSKQNNTLKALIGRVQKAAQSNKIIPKHALRNKMGPPPGQWQMRKIVPNKTSATSAHKRRLIVFDIIMNFELYKFSFCFIIDV